MNADDLADDVKILHLRALARRNFESPVSDLDR
jgi:hypothetical protein